MWDYSVDNLITDEIRNVLDVALDPAPVSFHGQDRLKSEAAF